MQIDHGSDKYLTSGSLLLGDLLAGDCEKQVGLDNSICEARHRRYNHWEMAMQNDFDHLDEAIGGKDLHGNQDPIVNFSI